MRVKATNKFEKDRVYPQELKGSIPKAGFEFELTEERAKILKEKGYVEYIEVAKKEPIVEKAVKKTAKKSK